jgi:hypothetical protein
MAEEADFLGKISWYLSGPMVGAGFSGYDMCR